MRPTNENLSSNTATKALTQSLVAAALDNASLTYGQAKQLLEDQVGFDSLARAGRTGYTAGAAIDKLQVVDPSVPLLNVLLVQQATKLPSNGAGSYLAHRYDQPTLAEERAKDLYPELWRTTFDTAAGEVYATPLAEWQRVYEMAYQEPLDLQQIEQLREQRKTGTEQDGINHGRTGEGPNHQALRLWVCANPSLVRPELENAAAATEFVLDSADRVDVLFRTASGVVAVEVKCRDSNIVDLRRGVFQCIKYRAVLQAMDIRGSDVIHAMLVTEEVLPSEIKALVSKHRISHFCAPKDRN